MKYKHIYGPVSSWRLGSSLGVDAVYTGRGKICSLDCVYCQVGRGYALTGKRKIFIPTENIIEEIKKLPSLAVDYITLSGAGEPTLARNLGDIIKKIRKIRKEKIAVLTNSSLIDKKDVQKDLALADFVVAKLDAYSQRLFDRINQPLKTVKLGKILKGLKKFRSLYKGKFALQIMFIKENRKYAKKIALLARKLKPDEIHINTPLRECNVKPLTKREIDEIKKFFKGTNCISVYDTKKRKKKHDVRYGYSRRRPCRSYSGDIHRKGKT